MSSHSVTLRASPRRRVHVVAATGYAAFLYVFSPMSLFVFGWFADFEDAVSHRVHEVSIGALFVVGFVGVLAHLRRTHRAAGSVQAVVALCFAAGVITATTGFEPLVLAYLLPPLVLIALDPEWRTTVSPPMARDTRLVVLAGVLVVLVGPQIPTNFGKAAELVQGHEAHWGAMAAFAITVALLAVVVSHRPPGWRVTAWSVGIVVAANAVVSLAFRFDASALRVSAALLALMWVGGFTIAAVVASMEQDSVPVRHPESGLVAGVAVGLEQHRGWSRKWLRVGFAIPLVGPAAYLLLWLLLPSSGAARSGTRGGWIVALLIVVIVGSPFGGELLLVPIGLAVGAVLVRWRVRRTRAVAAPRRVRLARVIAGLGVVSGVLGIALFWLVGETAPPNVPHKIDNISSTYCAACHGNVGVARGAPVLDLHVHAGGSSCISCHDHLPPSGIPGSEALWWPPLEDRG